MLTRVRALSAILMTATLLAGKTFVSTGSAQSPGDIVLYAAGGVVSGPRWATEPDPQAAGGSAVVNRDNGDAKLGAPLASPGSYLELTFTAEAHVPYHLWLRMKAQNDAFVNDSVYVQLSGALNPSGAADYGISTTRAMNLILEDGANAGLSGWGWADNFYGGFGTNVSFATAGAHTIRIQQREDGVTLDQVVLSPSTYLSTSPGLTKRDTTILPTSNDPPPPPPPPGAGDFKVATWNIRSGDGRCPITGGCPFVDSTQNCVDASLPLNAWGHGIPQAELAKLNSDPGIIAIGLQEGWACGQPSNVNRVLGWAYASAAFNGTGLVARFGIRGTLDNSLVSEPPHGPAYVVGADVCTDAACSATIRVYTAHLQASTTEPELSDPIVLKQAEKMIAWINTRPHADRHIIAADLNAYERERDVDFNCELTFDYQAPQVLRAAGYTDGWVALHGTAPGMTATLNKNGCGIANGGAWKRIDYGLLKGLTPVSSALFAVVPANTPAPSDHYGLMTAFTGATDPTAPPTAIVLPAGEILLRAADDTAPRISGRWAIAADPAANGGKSWANANLNELKIETPSASPASYFEVKFTAPANTPHHLWLRQRAQDDAYVNDSVYVQFSDGLNKANAPAYGIGTTDALRIILEDGSGAGVSGWGWADDGYGVLGTTVSFSTAGTHTIRIQQREDGASIDQILLSPSAYLTKSPGATKNDTTIFAATQRPQ